MKTGPTKFLIMSAVLSMMASVAYGEADIRLIDPWIRVTPPGTKVTGGYMTLQNDGGTDDVLLSVTSPSVETVEIHETKEKDGMMRMQKIDKLSISAGQRIDLAPGGYHLMLIGVRETDEVKRKWVTLVLNFAKSGPMEFKAPVRAVGQQASGDPSKKESTQ